MPNNINKSPIVTDSNPPENNTYHVFHEEKLAGQDLLNRPHPQGYPEEWLQALKQPLIEETDIDKISVLIFRIQNEILALPTLAVTEVTESTLIHKLPHRSTDTILGLTNVEGELQIAISMANLLGLDETKVENAPTQGFQIYPRAIVFGFNKNSFVFPVNEVFGVIKVKSENIEPVPLSVSKSLKNFSSGIIIIDDKYAGLLNEKLLINSIKERLL